MTWLMSASTYTKCCRIYGRHKMKPKGRDIKMKKTLAMILALLLAVGVSGCGNSGSAGSSAESGSPQSDSSQTVPVEDTDTTGADGDNTAAGDSSGQSEGNVLVAYFAYSENMGDVSGMEVDAITSASLNRSTNNTEGNLQVMAQVVEEKTGADVFHILMEEPYDPDYSTMLPVAIDQMENEDWPALQEKIDNLADYDVIYLGVPVWNAVMPPAMQTFFAENDLSGKTIIPFGIHLGSRFGRMIDEMKELAPGATVVDGFTINAETANDEVRAQFSEWLEQQISD